MRRKVCRSKVLAGHRRRVCSGGCLVLCCAADDMRVVMRDVSRVCADRVAAIAVVEEDSYTV